MGSIHPIVGLLLLFLFLIIDHVLYCFSAAITAVNRGSIEKMSEEGEKKADTVLKILDSSLIFTDALDITTFITNIAAGAYILRSLADFFSSAANINSALSVWITALVLIVLLLIFGVIVPKKVGTRFPEKSAIKYCRIAYVYTKICTPFTGFINILSWPILRLRGINPKDEEDNVTEEEIITMVNEGQEHGVLEASEAEMITNIFEFGEKQAHEVMIHRSNVVALDSETTLSEAFDIMMNENFSRYPVYTGDIDTIVGLIYLRDVVKSINENSENSSKKISEVAQLIREACFIPETRNIDALFKELKTKKFHLAIVVDEYGQTSGIVTMEDIIEEIVGNIFDEYDEEEELIEKKSEDVYEVDGLMLLDDLEETLSITFETEDFETLNGFMIYNLHRLPKDDEDGEVEYSGYRFKVLEASGKVIRKVRITRIEENKESENVGTDSTAE